MTRTDPCPDCPNVERRQGERRQVVNQTFAYCARLVGIITVATASISIGAAVSISQAITSTIHREHITDMQALRDWSQDMEPASSNWRPDEARRTGGNRYRPADRF